MSNLENNTFWVEGEIESETILPIVKNMLELLNFDNLNQLGLLKTTKTKKPLKIYISSEGGCVTSGFMLIDVMNRMKSEGFIVNTIAMGEVASMASVILANGSKGYRWAFPSSQIMIHEVSNIFVGDTSLNMKGILSEVEKLEVLNNSLFDSLAINTNKSLEIIREACSFDNKMNAEEALKFGLIDNIGVL